MTGIFARTGHNYQVLLVMYSCMIDPRICLTFFGLENRLTKPKPLWFQFPPTKRFFTCSSILTSNITLSLKLQKGNLVDFSGIHFFGGENIENFQSTLGWFFCRTQSTDLLQDLSQMSQKGWGQMPCFLRQVGVFRSETSHKKHVTMENLHPVDERVLSWEIFNACWCIILPHCDITRKN